MISIIDNEKRIADKLISSLIEQKSFLPFLNLSKDNKYLGWVYDFNIVFSGKNVSLDLRKENDLFLLFALASAWSRTGQWENAAYLIAYLKHSNKNTPDYWISVENRDYELENRFKLAQQLNYKFSAARINLSFRNDTFYSIHKLAINGECIKNELDKEDFYEFIKYIRDIDGLGARSNRMFIKIPLILRELRCQEIYDNIPGKYCCVPDYRVRNAAKDLKISLPRLYYNINSLIKVSGKIYSLFGDLYDIPLFAYPDLKIKI